MGALVGYDFCFRVRDISLAVKGSRASTDSFRAFSLTPEFVSPGCSGARQNLKSEVSVLFLFSPFGFSSRIAAVSGNGESESGVSRVSELSFAALPLGSPAHALTAREVVAVHWSLAERQAARYLEAFSAPSSARSGESAFFGSSLCHGMLRRAREEEREKERTRSRFPLECVAGVAVGCGWDAAHLKGRIRWPAYHLSFGLSPPHLSFFPLAPCPRQRPSVPVPRGPRCSWARLAAPIKAFGNKRRDWRSGLSFLFLAFWAGTFGGFCVLRGEWSVLATPPTG